MLKRVRRGIAMTPGFGSAFPGPLGEGIVFGTVWCDACVVASVQDDKTPGHCQRHVSIIGCQKNQERSLRSDLQADN